MKTWLRALCAFAAALCLTTSLHAQVDPRGDVRTIRTQHFRVHFKSSHEDLARRSAAYAELAWQQLAQELAEPALPVELLIGDNVDFSNGFATPFPSNRIVVFALPSVFTPELRHYDDWLQLVITHELAHIFHLDRARGLWSFGRKIFGRNPGLLPNAYLPSWMIEGLAVHYETKFTGAGRLAGTEFPMIARTAALRNEVPPPHEWSLTSSRFPLGQHAYGYGALIMSQLAARDSGGMRKFVDGVGTHLIPWRINRAAKKGFGIGIPQLFALYADSLWRTVPDVRAWAARDTVPRLVADEMEWFAAQPRWESDSTLLVGMNNGLDVPGVYRAHAGVANITLERIARRNSLDANALAADGAMVFGQIDLNDPFEIRNTLWRRDPKGNESELPGTERFFLPDVRRSDNTVLAVRARDGALDLVSRDASGRVRVIAAGTLDTIFTEARWSPDGARIAAVRVIRGGVQEIVVLDTLGTVRTIVHSARGVAAVPTWTPDGTRILWSSDQLGSMQLHVTELSACSSACDVRTLTMSPTGMTAPSVSPDGSRVAALEYSLEGARLTVLPLHDGYALDPDLTADRTPHVAPYAAVSRAATVVPDSSPSTPYRPLRQLLPRWWMPLVGEGSDGGATYGLASSGVDILRRHSWLAQATWDPSRKELEGAAGYRYARFPRVLGWQPALDFGGSQSWDRFTVVDTGSRPLGELQRVSRVMTASVSFARPRVRTSTNVAIGAQLDTRDYGTTPPALLTTLNPRFARGTQTPGVFLSGSFGNLMRAGRAISLEDGFTLSGLVQQRWKSGALEQTSRRATGQLRAYKAFDIGGFARHALAVRASGGVIDQHSTSELSVGGTSGSLAALVPGVQVGDPSRLFPVRGFAPGVQRGTQAVSGTFEYRTPLALLARGVGLVPLFIDRLSLSLYADAGRAWCASAVRETPGAGGLCLPVGARDGWLASVGAETAIDLGVQLDIPYRVRLGVAQPVVRPGDVPGGVSVYFTLGSSF